MAEIIGVVSEVGGVLGFLVSPAKEALLACLPDESKSGVIEKVRSILTSEVKQIDNRVKNIQEESWHSALDYFNDVLRIINTKFNALDARPREQDRQQLKERLSRAEENAIKAINMGNKLEKKAGGFPLLEAFSIREFSVMLREMLQTDANNICESVKLIVGTWNDDIHSKYLYSQPSVQQCLNNNLNPGRVQGFLRWNQKDKAFEMMESLLSHMLDWTTDLARTVAHNQQLITFIDEFVQNIDQPKGTNATLPRFLAAKVTDTRILLRDIKYGEVSLTPPSKLFPFSAAKAAGPTLQGQAFLITGSRCSRSMELYSLITNTSDPVGIRMNENRWTHVSGVLSDGRVMVTGGKNIPNGPALSSTELIHLDSPKVTQGPPMNKARSHASLAVLNGDLYVGGGKDEKANCLSRCEVFRDGKWINISDMKKARYRHTMVATDKFIYSIGGLGKKKGDYPDSMERYSPDTDTWQIVTHANYKRYDLAAAQLNGCVYVAGGMDQYGNALRLCECYDPVANQWNKVADMNVARRDFSLVSVDGKLYALGERGPTRTVESYDVGGNQWTMVGELGEKRCWSSAVLVPYC